MKNSLNQILICAIVAMCCTFFGCTTREPSDFCENPHFPCIYPDYTNITIPPNIAPMNFEIQTEGSAFLTKIFGKNGKPVFVAGKQVTIPAASWQDLLEKNQGEEIQFLIYTKIDESWQRYAPITNKVAKDPIDGWITYRLIEPGYERYCDIEINQRHLSSFEERPFYSNDWVTKGQCANCHAFQNWRTDHILFHVRIDKSGTLFIQDGEAKKIGLKTEETISAGAHPSWHPDLNLVVFSVNMTRQIFHTVSKAKIEVLDGASDLVLYDVDANEITHILKTDDRLETFPHWSPDGNWLYYCSAQADFDIDTSEQADFYEGTEATDLDAQMSQMVKHFDQIRYNLMRLPFDRQTKQFGMPEIVVDAVSQEKSVSFPRISPDGRFVMFTLSHYGNFSIWHPESDLWLHEIQTGENRPLAEVNSEAADSFHNWSSNGRWFVFCTRRDDGSYTRLYLAHFDESGIASKPFLLPQYDPSQNLDLMKSYNVPEFTVEPAQIPFMELLQALQSEAEHLTYRSHDEQ